MLEVSNFRGLGLLEISRVSFISRLKQPGSAVRVLLYVTAAKYSYFSAKYKAVSGFNTYEANQGCPAPGCSRQAKAGIHEGGAGA